MHREETACSYSYTRRQVRFSVCGTGVLLPAGCTTWGRVRLFIIVCIHRAEVAGILRKRMAYFGSLRSRMRPWLWHRLCMLSIHAACASAAVQLSWVSCNDKSDADIDGPEADQASSSSYHRMRTSVCLPYIMCISMMSMLGGSTQIRSRQPVAWYLRPYWDMINTCNKTPCRSRMLNPCLQMYVDPPCR